MDPSATSALLAHARRAVTPLVAEVRERLRARGVVTFQDLLGRTAELLRRERGLTSRLRRGIDQLLVDEFQDTDRVQCELLRWIALDGPRDERPGLFLVGDPKQSIYGWRGADLRAYDGFVDLARRHPPPPPTFVNRLTSSLASASTPGQRPWP